MRRLVLGLLVVRCATIAETAGGDQNLPFAGGGPFRKLAATEVHGAPFVLDDGTALYRAPAALPLGGTEVALYFVMFDKTSGHDVIARSRALDGRTFYGATQDFGHAPRVVIDAPLRPPSHPSVLRVAGEVWLYYTSGGSVFRGRGADGFTFTGDDAPVIDASAFGAIDTVSVAELPDGTFRMMFARDHALYEALSADGATWSEDGGGPVLTPAIATTADGGIEPFDDVDVGEPCLAPRVTVANRLQFRVLYHGAGGANSGIGYAARYDAHGPLVRVSAPVYSIGKGESSPALFEWGAGSFLYVEQTQTSLSATTYRALAGAVAPTSITLADASDYPDSP